MKKYLLLFILCTSLFVFGMGCSSKYAAKTPTAYVARTPTAPTYQPVPYQPSDKKVEIISEPAGARIEVNDNYVGDAPITVEIPQHNGQFTQATMIRALPTEAGDYVQSKYFLFTPAINPGYAYGIEAKGDQIPSRIFFDMHLGPATPAVDVNVIPSN